MFAILVYVFSLILMFGVVGFGYTKLTLPVDTAPRTAASGPTTVTTHTVGAKSSECQKTYPTSRARD